MPAGWRSWIWSSGAERGDVRSRSPVRWGGPAAAAGFDCVTVNAQAALGNAGVVIAVSDRDATVLVTANDGVGPIVVFGHHAKWIFSFACDDVERCPRIIRSDSETVIVSEAADDCVSCDMECAARRVCVDADPIRGTDKELICVGAGELD